MAQDIFASSPELDIRKRWATSQLLQGSEATPVHHPLQALARALQGAMGGYQAYNADQEDKAAGAAMFNSLPGLSTAGQPAAAPAAAPAPQASAPDPSQPRGIRNNNPLNIESGKYAERQPGFAGSDGRFARFDTPESGLGAADRLLTSYNKNQGINTVAGIINRWAPASDGNPVTAYATSVAKDMGVDPNQPLDMNNPQVRQAIILSMGKFENGKPIQPPQQPGQQPYQVAGPPTAAPGLPPAQAPQQGLPPVAGANLPGAAQPNAPVGNRSSVQIPPDVAQTIQRLGADPRTRPQAMQLYMQYAKPVESIQPMNAEQRKQWNVPEGVSAGIDSVTGKPVFSQPANSVSVNTAANPLMEGVGKQVLAQRQAGQTAATQTIPSIHEARRALDEGAVTGMFAEGKVNFQKIGALFGLDSSQASNTEVLRSAIGNGVLAHIKELGANPSNADRDYIEKVQGGNIALEEKSIRKILDIQEKYARQAIRNFNADAGKLMGAPGGAEAYKSVAPLMSIEEPGQYVAPEKKAATQTAPVEKTIGGKTYYKHGDQWFEK